MNETTSQPKTLHRYLSNGMEVCLHSTDFAPLVCMQCVVKVGSIDETEEEGGLSHVLEHMLFKGSQKFPGLGEVATMVEAAGGDVNAYTTFDHTNYYFTAPSDFAFQGAEMLLDVVENSLLDETELKKELEVVLEEIRRSKDNPAAVLSHSLFEKIYRTTRLSRPVIGYVDVVKGFQRSLLFDFYKRWYVPNNMIFIAAGDFDAEQLFQYLEELTQNFKPKSVPTRERPALSLLSSTAPTLVEKEGEEQTSPQPPAISWPKEEPCVILKRGPWQEIRLQIATYAAALEDYEMPVWDVLSAVLGESDSSRLVRLLRDELQLVTSVDASCYTPRYPKGIFSAGFFSMTENAQEALRVILQEIHKLGNVPPSREELSRVCNAIKAQRIYSRESMDGITRASALSLMTSSKLDFEERYVNRILHVTPEEVQTLAQKVWSDLENGLWTISIAMSAEKQTQWDEEEWKSLVFDAVKSVGHAHDLRGAAQNMNSENAVQKSPVIQNISDRNSDVKQYLISLPQGKRLHVNYRVSRRLPVVSGMLSFQGGLTREPDSQNGIAGLTMSMLTRGTKRQSYRRFIEELEDNASNISAFSGRDVLGLRFDSLKESALRTVEMLCDAFLQPEFSQEEWNRLHRETLEILIAQKDSPTAKLSRSLQSLLFPNHPYSKMSSGTTESVTSLTRENAVEFWNQIFHAQDFVLSLTGDFDIQKIVDLVTDDLTQFLQNMPDMPAWPQVSKTSPLQSTDSRFAFEHLEREQTHLSLSFQTCSLLNEDRTALEVAASILAGQGGRLFLDLRDARSLAYTVSASHSPSLSGGYFCLYIASAPHKVFEALEGLKRHVEELAVTPPSDQELSRAQKALIGSQSIESQHHTYQASQLGMSDTYGLPFDNFLGFADRVNAVTAEKVSQVLRKLMQKNPPVLVAVGSENPQLKGDARWDDLFQWKITS